MGNTSGGTRRRSSLEDNQNIGPVRPKPFESFFQDPSNDDSIISIITESSAVCAMADQLRETHIYGSSGKTPIYVDPTAGLELEESLNSRNVPTVFRWDGGGKVVYISGTFNGWKSKIPMVKSSSKQNFYTIVDLPVGEYQYKFIVDGQWKLDHNQPINTSPNGLQNNCIEVKESDLNVLTALNHDIANSRSSVTSNRPINTDDGSFGKSVDNNSTVDLLQPSVPIVSPNQPTDGCDFDSYLSGSNSPPGEYHSVIPSNPNDMLCQTQVSTSNLLDSKKVAPPPLLPPQLLQVILNRDTKLQYDPNLLPQPDHVMVNHMYALSIKDGVIVLSATTRYRQKFVSTVLYKPI